MRLVQDTQSRWIGRPAFSLKSGGARPPVALGEAISVEASGPMVRLRVLDNDIDPEGGILTLSSVFAALGTAIANPDGTVSYTPPAGITGFDSVVYDITDDQGLTATGQADIQLVTPVLGVVSTSDSRLEVEAASVAIDITVTAPSDFAGDYEPDLALLADGPVNLLAPAVVGIFGDGQTLTAKPGLWIQNAAETATRALQWTRDGVDIADAVGNTFVLGPADLAAYVTVRETLTTVSGTRTALAEGVSAAGFSPAVDASLLAWFDASDAATLTETSGIVSGWASKSGAASLSQSYGPSRPATGSRTIGGRNVVDFGTNQEMTGPLTLPSGDTLALHLVVSIDGVGNEYAGLVALDATADMQVDAGSSNSFTGRLSTSGIGDSVVLSGGPFPGERIISILFDLASGTSEVFIDGILRGQGAMTAPLDVAQALHLFTNRSKNANVVGAAGEVVVTTDISNRNDYHGYLAAKWGIS